MAFNPAPSNWFDSWSEDGTNITVPIATFPRLTAAEADGTTGDIRKVLFAILDKLYSEWTERLAADRPTRMTVARTKSYNDASGTVTEVHTITLVNTITDEEVKAE